MVQSVILLSIKKDRSLSYQCRKVSCHPVKLFHASEIAVFPFYKLIVNGMSKVLR